MQSFGVILALLGTLLFLFALVNVVYPIKALKIPTRKRALLILAASLVAFVAGTVIAGRNTVQGTDKATSITPEATKASPEGEAPASPEEGIVLAAWEVVWSRNLITPNHFPSKNFLICRDDTITLEAEHSFKESDSDEIGDSIK